MALSRVGLVTVGTGQTEDRKILFDGNAQDFHIGLDDSADDLVIGKGSALGTTANIVIDENGHVTKPLQSAFLALNDGSDSITNATTTTIALDSEVFDGNAQDYHIGLDDSVDDLVIGKGSALGTTANIVFDEAGCVTKPLQPAFFSCK